MKPLEVLRDFDLFLESKGLELEAIVIGGAALGIMGVISRETRDCDVLDPDRMNALARKLGHGL